MQSPLSQARDEIVRSELQATCFKIGDFMTFEDFEPIFGQFIGVGDGNAPAKHK